LPLRFSGLRSRQSGTHSTNHVSGLAKLPAVTGAAGVRPSRLQKLSKQPWTSSTRGRSPSDVAEEDRRRGVDPATAGSGQEVLQCLAEAGRTGPPLAEPVGVRPPGGAVSDQRGRLPAQHLDSPGFPGRRMTAPSPLGSAVLVGLVGRDRRHRRRNDAPGASTSSSTRHDEHGWRATFYTTGMEHSPTSAPHRYEELCRHFQDAQDVRVILDPREGERRI
jgi:hypothetical protein